MSVTLNKHHSLQSHVTTDADLHNELDAGSVPKPVLPLQGHH